MWKCSSLYFLKFLDVDIVSKELQEAQEVFHKVPESKRTIIMVVFKLYYVLACSNLNYKDFCNLNYILLVCKTFCKYLGYHLGW